MYRINKCIYTKDISCRYTYLHFEHYEGDVMDSIWTEDVELPRFHSLEGDIKTDVLIVGGGLAGILCAYMLDQKGIDYVLVEGKRIASGITQNTTAKITAQHGLMYHKLLKSEGMEKTQMYMEANQRAVLAKAKVM